MAAKSLPAAAVAVLALCFVGVALATSDSFTIQGRVYCDTCRAGFETSITEYIGGGRVSVECMNFTTEQVTLKKEVGVDATGTYSVEISGSHEEEICEVVLGESSRADCSEIKHGRDRARVVLSRDSGISSNVRYANSLGYLKEDPLPACGKLLQMYALSDDLNY